MLLVFLLISNLFFRFLCIHVHKLNNLNIKLPILNESCIWLGIWRYIWFLGYIYSKNQPMSKFVTCIQHIIGYIDINFLMLDHIYDVDKKYWISCMLWIRWINGPSYHFKLLKYMLNVLEEHYNKAQYETLND